jgi:hypothetical protein
MHVIDDSPTKPFFLIIAPQDHGSSLSQPLITNLHIWCQDDDENPIWVSFLGLCREQQWITLASARVRCVSALASATSFV